MKVPDCHRPALPDKMTDPAGATVHLVRAASPLYQVYQGQFRFSATTLTLVLTVYVAANGLLGWRSLTETPPGNVIADAIHSRMFCAPRLTNAYHFSRHSYSAIWREGPPLCRYVM